MIGTIKRQGVVKKKRSIISSFPQGIAVKRLVSLINRVSSPRLPVDFLSSINRVSQLNAFHS